MAKFNVRARTKSGRVPGVARAEMRRHHVSARVNVSCVRTRPSLGGLIRIECHAVAAFAGAGLRARGALAGVGAGAGTGALGRLPRPIDFARELRCRA